MVLLAMSSSLADLVQVYTKHAAKDELGQDEFWLISPAPGSPIPHQKIVLLSRWARKQAPSLPSHTIKNGSVRLDDLLRGCSVYQPTRARTVEKSLEYKALMEKLRRDAELQSYNRMLSRNSNKASPLFNDGSDGMDDTDQDMTYAQVNRQMAVVVNVLVSVIACGIAIWMAARWWRTEARLVLSLTGAAVVGVAEVVIYNGYLGRLQAAKTVERSKVEVKIVKESWLIDAQISKKQTTQLDTIKQRK